MKTPDSIRLLKIAAWVGLALVVIGALFVRYMRVMQVTRMVQMAPPSGVAEDQVIPSDEPLGELNSHCGGPMRLPCRPGLACSVDQRETDLLGTCTQSLASAYGERQLRETCSREQPCASGLYCAPTAAGDSCALFDTGAPRNMSLKLEGMQFTNGIYQASAGQEIVVHIVAVNAQRVLLRLHPSGQESTEIGALTPSDGGNYSGSFVMPVGFSGRVEAIADAGAKGFSMLSSMAQSAE